MAVIERDCTIDEEEQEIEGNAVVKRRLDIAGSPSLPSRGARGFVCCREPYLRAETLARFAAGAAKGSIRPANQDN